MGVADIIIYPAFFVVVNIFPLLHLIKGAKDQKSNSVWVAWYLGYYLFYNSLVHPFSVVLTNVLGMKSTYMLVLTCGIGALTNPVNPMLTTVFGKVYAKIVGIWRPIEKINNNLREICDILIDPVNMAILFVLDQCATKIPGWTETCAPALDKVLAQVNSDHRSDAGGSPKAAKTLTGQELKEVAENLKDK